MEWQYFPVIKNIITWTHNLIHVENVLLIVKVVVLNYYVCNVNWDIIWSKIIYAKNVTLIIALNALILRHAISVNLAIVLMLKVYVYQAIALILIV